MFEGITYDPELDKERLEKLLGRVYDLMRDGRWRTLDEIKQSAGGSEASVSARLRDLRKEQFGGYVVGRRRRGDPTHGLFEYQMLSPKGEPIVPRPSYDTTGQGHLFGQVSNG